MPDQALSTTLDDSFERYLQDKGRGGDGGNLVTSTENPPSRTSMSACSGSTPDTSPAIEDSYGLL